MKALPWHRRRNRRETLKYYCARRRTYGICSNAAAAGVTPCSKHCAGRRAVNFRNMPRCKSRRQGAFMALIVAATGARRAIEVGTFTGISAIYTARGLPKDGHLLCSI